MHKIMLKVDDLFLNFFLSLLLFRFILQITRLTLCTWSLAAWTWLSETFDDAMSNDTPVKVGESLLNSESK